MNDTEVFYYFLLHGLEFRLNTDLDTHVEEESEIFISISR